MQGPAGEIQVLTSGWLFGGAYSAGDEQPGADERRFAPVSLPHCVVELDWHEWDPASWQQEWVYRRHIGARRRAGERVFVDFAGSMTASTVFLNGRELGRHCGGYLPFGFEITELLQDGDNVLAVVVDGRWADIPPDGAPAGAQAVDYLQPAGLYREVSLRTVPATFIGDLFAKPVDVLSGSPRVQIEAGIVGVVADPASLHIRLSRYGNPVAETEAAVEAGTVRAVLDGLRGIELWDVESPNLYDVVATLHLDGRPVHEYSARIGFREARFENDGFFLNGRRLQLFGLNRHQIFPYAGMAMPARVQRKDAEICKYEFNCNMVRCSHYPQSAHFLDACDEIGLLVWEEPAGWQYVSADPSWRDLADRDVHDMVVRDRNRPSIVLWAARLNETENYPDFYTRTRETVRELDDSRPTTGAMIYHDTADWVQDVFSYDDYSSKDGNAFLKPPLDGVPYLVSESVGALSGPPLYRWLDDAGTLARQAICHAQVHDQAASDQRYLGLLGWCAFDYDSLHGNTYKQMKTPGIADTFRVPKPGAAFYRSQVDPAQRVVIEPVFFWDFGPDSPPAGPGAGAVIASNCDRLEIHVDGEHRISARPDTATFPHLRHPLFVVDLALTGTELRIDGYVGERKVGTRLMSADTARDRLVLQADDTRIACDGADATRVVFRAADEHGNQRPYVTGAVRLHLSGPGRLIGPHAFDWADTPGVGAVWVAGRDGETATVRLTAAHPELGTASCEIEVS